MSVASMERSRSSNVSLHGRDDLRLSSDGFDTSVTTSARPYVTTSYRGVIMRAITLVCACSLSIGAHFARDTLGPLKSKLGREMGTNNAQFSLLMAAYSLNSTWTPLLGGLLASKLGTSYTSLLATGSIFLGQLFLLLGNLSGNFHVMVVGMLIYGLGVSPLSVVQEAIIVRFFRHHGLGVSMALGLVAGKMASFLAARTSYPLSERYGAHAPFAVATILSTFSLLMNILYVSMSGWLVKGTGVELEESEPGQTSHQPHLSDSQAVAYVAEKRVVRLGDLASLGDVFWAYIAVNLCCGLIWAPFTQLAANIFQQRYHLTEADAGRSASYLLAGSVVLYPACGLIVDRVRANGMAMKLLITSSCLTLLAYLWMAAPASVTKTPVPAILTYATAAGFSPLLLAIVVPQLVPAQYVATTLGAHKSIERTGETLFQTIAGLVLDHGASQSAQARIQTLLNVFVLMNGLHLCSVLVLLRLYNHTTAHQLLSVQDGIDERMPLRTSTDEAEDIFNVQIDEALSDETPLLPLSSDTSSSEHNTQDSTPMRHAGGEASRGRLFMKSYFAFIALTWVVFLATAWLKLRSKLLRNKTIVL